MICKWIFLLILLLILLRVFYLNWYYITKQDVKKRKKEVDDVFGRSVKRLWK